MGVGVFHCVFNGAMHGDLKAQQFVGTDRSKIDSCGSAFGDGIHAGAAVNGADVESGTRFLGDRGSDQRSEGVREGCDGVGQARIGKAVAPGTGDGDLKTAAAQGLGDSRIWPGAVENDVGGDAAGDGTAVVELANAAQVAFALFAHVAHEQERGGQFCFGVGESIGDREQPSHAGRVVAGSGRFEAVDAILLAQRRIERRIGGKHGVKVSRENNKRAGAVGVEIGRIEKAENVTHFIGLDVGEPDFDESLRKPAPAGSLPEWRSRNRHHRELPVHDGFGIPMEPGEGRMRLPPGGDCRDPMKCGCAGD